jgi:cytoskeletal protein CcmA (bactofilin family)
MVTGTLRLTGSEAGILVIEKAPGDTTKEIVFVEQGTEQGGIYFNNGDHLFIRNENNAKDIILRIENGSGAGRNLIRLDGTNEGVVVGFANSKTETSLNAVLDVDGNTVVSGTLKSTGHISSVGGVTASVALSGTNLYLPAPSGTIAGGDSYLAVDNTGRVILTPKPGAVGGSDNQVQYNNDGVLAGSSNLTWDDNELRVVGQISASTLKVHGDIRTTGSLFVDTNLDVDGQLNADNAISGGAEIYGHHLRTSGDVKASGTLSSSYFQIQGVQLTRQAIISADSSIALQANQIILGTNGDVDINLDFNANSNDGRITWSEDEDYFAFADDIAMPAGEAIFFRDANQKLISDNAGHLDIYADDNIELHAEDIICSGTLQVLSGNNTVFQVDAEDGDTGDNGLLRAKQITITQHNFDFNAVNTSRWVPWQDDAGATFPGSPNQAFFRIQPFGGRLLKVVLMIEGWGDPGDLPLEMGLGFYTGSAPYGGAGAVNRFIDSSIWKGSVTGTMSNPSFGGYQNQKPMPLIINLSGSETFHRTGSFTFKPGKTVGMSLTVGGTDPEAILMTCVWEYDYFDEFFAPIQAGTGTV